MEKAHHRDLRGDFYAEIANDCTDWLRLLAEEDELFYQPLREEICRVFVWASLQYDISEAEE